MFPAIFKFIFVRLYQLVLSHALLSLDFSPLHLPLPNVMKSFIWV